MKKGLYLVLPAAMITGFALFGVKHSHAAQSTTPSLTQYLMLRLPATPIAYPVYVYQAPLTAPTNQTQIDYITTPSQQVFLGRYDSTNNNVYYLYYQQAGKWYNCQFTFSNMQLSNVAGCTGVVINQPPSGTGIVNNKSQTVTSNGWPLTMGAYAWAPNNIAPTNPVPTNFSAQRTITFINKTQYPAIQIGMACTVAKNPSNPTCQNTNALFGTSGITQGNAKAVNIPQQGLISSAFYVSAYESTTDGPWQQTGGYYAGQQPYATKFEPTWQNAGAPDPITQVPSVIPTNIDMSAVDGFNFGAILYPTTPTYCTFTIGEGSNIMGVGYYSQSNPLAQLVPTPALPLTQLCTNSTTNGWDLSAYAASENSTGCQSPCSYAKLNLSSDVDTVDRYCCKGKYGAQALDCYGPGLGSSSNYVTQLTENATHVYTFAYGDADGDYGCPGMSNFVVEVH